MQEMVEPDRTILIVSIIGLVVIWGSVAYHKWLQDGREAVVDDDELAMGESPGDAEPAAAAAADAGGGKGKGKARKGRRN